MTASWHEGTNGRRVVVTLATSLLVVAVVGSARAQPRPSAGPAASAAPQALSAPTWTVSFRDALRVETWRFFDPPADGGNPDYTFAGNRLLLQAVLVSPRVDVTLAVQHVGLAGLPDDAVGPGALGTGPIYYAQGGRSPHPQKLYLRYANVRLKAPRFTLQAGRMAYASGMEAPTQVAKIEAVKRQRLAARLVGEFEWSLYQRGFDGVRADVFGSAWRLSGFAFMPTQGGFAREAGTTMTDVVVAGATLSRVPPAGSSGTQVQGFVLYYGDSREITGRPDNTGRQAARADVSIATVGGTLIGAYPTGEGAADVLLWAAVQQGSWYDDDHRALAVAAEAGHQWTEAPWAPWIRAGFFHASGDDSVADGSHGTFFPMLPTVRRFSQTTVYSTMNLRDLFVSGLVRPVPDLGVRVDVHRLTLASSADRWYAGSGATLSRGSNFGYVSRSSGGADGLGLTIETSATYTVSPRWTLQGFLGRMAAGDVVTRSFRGDGLWFFYVETNLSVDWSRR